MTKLRSYSLYRRMSLLLIVVYTVMFCLMLANSLYAAHVIRQKLSDRLYDALNLQCYQIEQRLMESQIYLIAQLPATSYLPIVVRNQKDSEYYLALRRLQTEMTSSMASMPYVSGLFVYPLTSRLFIPASHDSIVAVGVRDFVTDVYERNLIDTYRERGWFPVEISGRYQLLRIFKVGLNYMGIWIDFSYILPDVKNRQTLEQIALFISDNGVFNENSQLSPYDGFTINPSALYTIEQLDEPYMLVAVEALGGHIALLVPDRLIRAELIQNYILMAVFGCVALVLALAAVLALRQYLHRPIAQLKGSMDDLRHGDFSTRIREDYVCEEFADVNKAFNKMVSRIEDLKISVYEEKLSQQRGEMRYLKNQIAPHFLINCLNAVYHMASAGDTESVKDMTVRMSNHLRYVLADITTVPLEREIQESINYVALSCLRFPDGISFVTDVNPLLSNAGVLPMILLGFIENTVKYEVVSGKRTDIHVKADFADEARSRVILTLWDTGGGWSDEILEYLNFGKMPDAESGYKIGIKNLWQRMTIVYNGDFHMRFSNRPGAGAQMEVVFAYLTHTPEGDVPV